MANSSGFGFVPGRDEIQFGLLSSADRAGPHIPSSAVPLSAGFNFL